jgi:long-chain acyl-CoA synthetase
MARNSILDFFIENAERYGNKTAALVKRDGTYREVTWKQMYDDAHKVSAGLLALGVVPGDRVNIVASTRLEWAIADLGILGAGGVTVPIYPSSLADECSYICDNSGAVVVIVEDANQVQKFKDERGKLGGVRKVVQMTGAVTDDAGGWVMSWEQIPPVQGQLRR